MIRRALIRDGARRDIDHHVSFFARTSPAAADRFLVALRSAIDSLVAMPGQGHPGEFLSPFLQGLRSWPISGFEKTLVLYGPWKGGIQVLAVIHGARDIPSLPFREEE